MTLEPQQIPVGKYLRTFAGVRLSAQMFSLCNAPEGRLFDTHVAVAGGKRTNGRGRAEGQAGPAQHGVARVLLQDVSVVEDAEVQNWRRDQGQCDAIPSPDVPERRRRRRRGWGWVGSHKKAPALMVALKREFSGALLPLVLESHANISSVSVTPRGMTNAPPPHFFFFFSSPDGGDQAAADGLVPPAEVFASPEKNAHVSNTFPVRSVDSRTGR